MKFRKLRDSGSENGARPWKPPEQGLLLEYPGMTTGKKLLNRMRVEPTSSGKSGVRLLKPTHGTTQNCMKACKEKYTCILDRCFMMKFRILRVSGSENAALPWNVLEQGFRFEYPATVVAIFLHSSTYIVYPSTVFLLI